MNLAGLKNAINQFSHSRVLVVGDLMLDHYISGTVLRISPEAPVPVLEFASESFNIGGAGNAAANISALQGRASIAGVIGDDMNGQKLLDLIKGKGLDTEGVIVVPDRPTTTKTRIIAEQQQVVRIDREVRNEISDKYVKQILSFVKKRLDQVEAVLISDYDKGLVTMKLLEGLVPLARRWHKPVVADSKFRYLSGYRGVTAVTPNLKEASATTGISPTDEVAIQRMGHWLLSRLECETVLITRGKDGISLFGNNGDMAVMPSVAKEVSDVTGAGDTVASVLTLGLAAGISTEDATLIANAAAGIVVGRLGVAVVTRDELTHQLEALERDGLLEIRRFKADSE